MVAWKAEVVKEQPGTGNRKFRKKIYYGSNLQPQQKITKSRAEPISWNRRPNELFGITGIEFEMVLPDRIELSTSPFITPALSRPPRGVCALDHPFIIGPWGP